MARAALWLYRALMTGALPLVAPALWVKDRAAGKSRPPWRSRLGRDLPPVEAGGVWIQAVSVGEVEVARRLVGELGSARPELPLFLTATTATGLALARRTVGREIPVHPCPVDLAGPVRRAFAHVRPRLLVLVETELWPETIHRASRLGIPVAVVNARLSERSFRRYRAVRGALRGLLEPVTRVLARSEADARRFAALGIAAERITVTGNVKYDLEADAAPLEWADRVGAWAGGGPVLVAGSTMEGEEKAVLDALARLPEGRRPFPVLAPRHPERFGTVAGLLSARGLAVARRSDLDAAPPRPDVLLLDTIGELGRAYRLAAAAFVGGSLAATGGHNPLEPAVWGVPVLTGPHVFNFREVYDEMIAAGAAVVVRDAASLAVALERWLERPEEARRAGAAGLAVVRANRGATARTVAGLLELLGG